MYDGAHEHFSSLFIKPTHRAALPSFRKRTRVILRLGILFTRITTHYDDGTGTSICPVGFTSVLVMPGFHTHFEGHTEDRWTCFTTPPPPPLCDTLEAKWTCAPTQWTSAPTCRASQWTRDGRSRYHRLAHIVSRTRSTTPFHQKPGRPVCRLLCISDWVHSAGTMT